MTIISQKRSWSSTWYR